ncbi:hypothetical protein NADFUDRAFT_64531 [Nadsonia fulvescens var. elongata DSM 6958]|uniref:Shugoshin C-terminal domain-containing protein n=1 Tax=Nadsonia fulvescens var. elongata DSM 6958 TaxID=857566 RepID=A0A1E3PQ76_9ASCO|nr:hypothetical protein NADFUDRAFT_64531 [Nadsonia fulvescens var. elongata DSM 6958]
MARLSDPPSGSSFQLERLNDYKAQNFKLARSNSTVQTKVALLEKKITILTNENLQLRHDNMRMSRERDLQAKEQYQKASQVWKQKLSDIRDYLGQLDGKIGEISETFDPLRLEDTRSRSGKLPDGRFIEFPQKETEEEKIRQLTMLMSSKLNGRRYTLEGENESVTGGEQTKKVCTNRRSSRRDSALINPADLPKFSDHSQENSTHTLSGKENLTNDPADLESSRSLDASLMQISDDCIPELDETLDYYPNVTMISNETETRVWEQDDDGFSSIRGDDQDIDAGGNFVLLTSENEPIHVNKEGQNRSLDVTPSSSPRITKITKHNEQFISPNLGNKTSSGVSSFKSKSKVAKSKALPSEAEKMPLVGSLSPSKTRSGRRARKEVNYALPSLRTKMRRNQPEMVDAVIDDNTLEELSNTFEDITPITLRKRKSSITNVAKRRKSTDPKNTPPSEASGNEVGLANSLQKTSFELMNGTDIATNTSEPAPESTQEPLKKSNEILSIKFNAQEGETGVINEKPTSSTNHVQSQPVDTLVKSVTATQIMNNLEKLVTDEEKKQTQESGARQIQEEKISSISNRIDNKFGNIETKSNEGTNQELNQDHKSSNNAIPKVRVKTEPDDELANVVVKEQDIYEGATSLDIASARRRSTRRQSGTYLSHSSNLLPSPNISNGNEKSSTKRNLATVSGPKASKEGNTSRSHTSTRKTMILEQSEKLGNTTKATRRKSTRVHKDGAISQKDIENNSPLEKFVEKSQPPEINENDTLTVSDTKKTSKNNSLKNSESSKPGTRKSIVNGPGAESSPKKKQPKGTRKSCSKSKASSTSSKKVPSTASTSKPSSPNTSIDVFDFMMDSGDEREASNHALKRPIQMRKRSSSTTLHTEKKAIVGNDKDKNPNDFSSSANAGPKRRKSMMI